MVYSPEEWVLGVSLCLLGAAMTSLGLTIQKRSFTQNDSLPCETQVSFARQPLWLFGFSIFIAGQLLNFLAMAFCPQSIAATLGAFSLVTNAIFAPLLLAERLSRNILLSISIICCGSVLVVLSSDRASQDYSLNQLMMLLKEPLFVSYMAVLSVGLLITLLRMWRAAKCIIASPTHNSHCDEVVMSPVTCNVKMQQQSANNQANQQLNGRNVSVTVDNSTLNSRHSSQLHQPLLHNQHSNSNALPDSPTSPSPSESAVPSLDSISPTLAAAILSSLSVTFGKCTSQLLKYSFQKQNQFNEATAWLITLLFLFCAIGSVHFLNVGLRRGTALFTIPFYYVSNTCLAVLGGLMFFKEIAELSVLRSLAFGAGVTLTVVGVWLSSRRQVRNESDGIDLVDEEFAAAYENMLAGANQFRRRSRMSNKDESQIAAETSVSRINSNLLHVKPIKKRTASAPCVDAIMDHRYNDGNNLQDCFVNHLNSPVNASSSTQVGAHEAEGSFHVQRTRTPSKSQYGTFAPTPYQTDTLDSFKHFQLFNNQLMQRSQTAVLPYHSSAHRRSKYSYRMNAHRASFKPAEKRKFNVAILGVGIS